MKNAKRNSELSKSEKDYFNYLEEEKKKQLKFITLAPNEK
mgnify:CR=1 FL=1